MNEQVEVPNTIPSRWRVVETHCDGKSTGADFLDDEGAFKTYLELVTVASEILAGKREVEYHPLMITLLVITESGEAVPCADIKMACSHMPLILLAEEES